MADLYQYLSEKYKPETLKEIEKRLLELTSLFEISQLLNASLELHHILNNLLLIPMGRLLISRGFIFLSRDGDFEIPMSKGLKNSNLPERIPYSEIQVPFLNLNDEHIGQSPYGSAPIIRIAVENNMRILIPFRSQDKFFGGIAYGEKLNKTAFSEEELNFLLSLANIATTSIENALQVEEIKQINRQLDQRIQELKTLFDIARGLSATLNKSRILKLLTYALMGQLITTKYGIFLKENRVLTLADSKNFPPQRMRLLQKLLPVRAKWKEIFASHEIESGILRETLEAAGVELIIPMIHQKKLLGYVLLGAKTNRQAYSPNEKEFLATLISQAIVSLENARLFQETVEKQRLEEELKVARQIQRNLLPRKFPDIRGYQICGQNIPTKEVGGDYFDIIPTEGDELVLAIGDVSGKGVPAALLMANLQAALQILISEGLPLPEVVQKLNLLIYHNTEPDKFITFFVGKLNTQSHEFEYVNAGHNPPLLLSPNGKMRPLEKGGLILGILPQETYQSETIRVGKGDLIFCYTDGVSESINARNEEYGEERIIELVKRLRKQDVSEICQSLVSSVKSFSRNQPQFDDITLLTLRRQA